MSNASDWLKQKEQLLGELTRYIAGCSNLDPRLVDYVLDYVAGLQTIKVFIETANEAELPRYVTWWASVRPDKGQPTPLEWAG